MQNEASDRLQAELDLLFAMYPGSLSYSRKERELRFSYSNGNSSSSRSAVLLLRLPDTYPLSGSPEVISAVGCQKEDLRSATKEAFHSIDMPEGEEVIDALIFGFSSLVSSRKHVYDNAANEPIQRRDSGKSTKPSHRTVVIWLHHLLNTKKRKLALNPPGAGTAISGVTKPGYPGVLIFSGDKYTVDLHVTELRNQRWQAFQIRYDDGSDTNNEESPREAWRFKHGAGIREVESMSEVAQDIVDPEQREVFIRCIGAK